MNAPLPPKPLSTKQTNEFQSKNIGENIRHLNVFSADINNKENVSFYGNFSSTNDEPKPNKNISKGIIKKNLPKKSGLHEKDQKFLLKKNRFESHIIDKKPDYSHVKSKIKDELDYHKELNKQSKKIKNTFKDREIEESHEISSHLPQDFPKEDQKKYYDDWQKKYSTIPNPMDIDKKTKNFYLDNSKPNRSGLNFYGKKKMDSDPNFLTYEKYGSGTYSNKFNTIPNNEENYQKSSNNSEYNENNRLSEPHNNNESFKYQAFGMKQYQQDQEEIEENSSEENYKIEQKTLDNDESEGHHVYVQPLHETSSRYSQSSSKQKQKNERKIVDIANNFLSSPLMGQLSSQEDENHYQKESSFMRKKREYEQNMNFYDSKDAISIKKKTDHENYHYSLKNEPMKNFSTAFFDVDSPHPYQNHISNPKKAYSSAYNNLKYSNINKKNGIENEPDNHSSSMSSNFSVFNPNEELKSFFQKEFLHNNGHREINESSFKVENEEDGNFRGSERTSNNSKKTRSNDNNKEYFEESDGNANEKKQVFDYSYLFKKKF